MDTLSVADVFRDAFALYRRLFARSITVAALIYLGFAGLTALVEGALDDPAVVAAVVSFLFGFAPAFLVEGALVATAADVRAGRPPPGVAESLRRLQPFVPRLAVVSVLYGVAVPLGLLLLVVPGLILMTMWALAVPVVVLEDSGARRALGRSADVTEDHRWRVFLVLVIVIAVSIALDLALVRLPTVPDWLASAVGATLVAPLAAHAITAIYFRILEPGTPVVPPKKSWQSVWDEERAARA